MSGPNELTFTVPGMTCDHCVLAVSDEVGRVPGVQAVTVDLATKVVVVTGEVSKGAVWAAVDEAGYEAVE